MKINIGPRLKEAMRIKGVRPYELSAMTGISRSNITNYLGNKYSPKSVNIAKLAKALGVSEYWLMGMESSETGEGQDTKSRIVSYLDEMNDSQLDKTEKFIVHVILEK